MATKTKSVNALPLDVPAMDETNISYIPTLASFDPMAAVRDGIAAQIDALLAQIADKDNVYTAMIEESQELYNRANQLKSEAALIQAEIATPKAQIQSLQAGLAAIERPITMPRENGERKQRAEALTADWYQSLTAKEFNVSDVESLTGRDIAGSRALLNKYKGLGVFQSCKDVSGSTGRHGFYIVNPNAPIN